MANQGRPRAPRIPITPLAELPGALTGGSVAIGNFDGLHRGHRYLLERTHADARARGVPAVVVTFDPHPRTVFQPENPVFRLTPLPSKSRLLTALGFDGLVVVPFDRALAARSAADFVSSILVEQLRISSVCIGYDFHFGRGREGSPEFLRKAGMKHGFAVDVIEPVLVAGQQPYSATRIRDALAAGDIAEANRLLGYRWFVIGTVVPGERRGRELGFPTANIRLGADCSLRHGIFAVQVTTADGIVRQGVASFGRRPTFDNGSPLLEVNVFDFSGSLYGQEVVVTFVAWLRGEERFDSAEQLIHQMQRDAEAARQELARAGRGGDLDEALARIA